MNPHNVCPFCQWSVEQFQAHEATGEPFPKQCGDCDSKDKLKAKVEAGGNPPPPDLERSNQNAWASL